MELKSIRDADVKDKRVLVRVDFNVPLMDGEVADDTRISAALPTITYLLEHGAYVVLCSHLGRPKGQARDELRLDPIAPVLQDLLIDWADEVGAPSALVIKRDDCIGNDVITALERASQRDVVLLENLRFHEGETKNDPEFVKQLAALADMYVSDAFGTVHRAHASTVGVARLLPAYAGFLVEREVKALSKVTTGPEHPLTVILGGAKVSGKIEVLERLIPIADSVLIGGAMANTFLKANGLETGKSLVEDEMLDTAKHLIEMAVTQGTHLLLPVDFEVTDSIEEPSRIDTVAAFNIGKDDICVDIGEQTREQFRKVISGSRTVFWNGPMGVFEVNNFAHGTLAVARALAMAYNRAHTVVGGGESVSAVNMAGVAARIHHVSTGGGASLEFVGGKELPGLKVLQ